MNKISEWIKQYCEKYGIRSLVIGVSGGIDSALTSKLCALTGIATIVLTMPIHQAPDQHLRGLGHIDWLNDEHRNVSHINLNLTSVYDAFVHLLNEDNIDSQTDAKGIDGINSAIELGYKRAKQEKYSHALANTRARLRMTALYQLAQVNGGIVVGTGNKVEDFGVGFFTKYGDGGVDISPIADLTKTEVREMAKELGVLEEILNAPPTDGLWDDGRTDEDQIGATYEELEWAMEYSGDGHDLTERQKEIKEIYNKFHTQNKHKMIPIPVYTKDA